MPDPYEAGKGRQRDLRGEDELQSYLEQAFGKNDVTSVKMRAALREWLDLYYGTPRAGEDAAPRLAALIVGVLVAWFSGNLFFVAAAGCVVVFLVEMLL